MTKYRILEVVSDRGGSYWIAQYRHMLSCWWKDLPSNLHDITLMGETRKASDSLQMANSLISRDRRKGSIIKVHEPS